MQRLQEISEKLSRISIYIGGALLIASAVLVAVEVVLRKVFLQSLQGADEFSGYVLAISVAWAFSYALYRRAHIRVDALYVRLPYKVCCVLDVISLLSLAIFFSILAYLATQVLMESIRLGAEANTVRRTPLWMPQILWAGGLIFFVYNIYLLLIRASLALFSGKFEEVRALAGAPSVTEEVVAEIGTRGDRPEGQELASREVL